MGKRKEFIGTVISNKMQKTIIVRVTQVSKHSKYNRIVKKYNKFKVHDEKKVAGVGDIVRIQETRPISKETHFRLVEVFRKTESPHLELDTNLHE